LIVTYSAIGAANDQPTRHEVDFPGLVAWLRTMYDSRGPGPKDGPWLCFADFNAHHENPQAVRRAYSHLIGSHAVPLDLDLGQYAWTAADITARLAGYQFVAWTSYSHTAEKPRWRIVVPVERPMTRHEHYATWESLAALFLRDAGESSKDATRLNYLPGACVDPAAAQFIVGEGKPYPVYIPDTVDVPEGTDGLTDAPIAGWAGPTDDDQLLAYMLQNRRAAEDAFAPAGHPTRFAALWNADAAALAPKFPHHEQEFDHTRADAALANELAFYTGSHGTRCLDLFMRSPLAQRERFREDKARRAVILACQRAPEQHAFLRPVPSSPSPESTSEHTRTVNGTTDPTRGTAPPSEPAAVSRAEDFYAYLPDHTYIHRPTGAHWPAASLDGTVGKDARMMLDLTHPVHRLSWAPGMAERFIWGELDATDELAATSWTYNRYRAPRRPRRSGAQIDPWLRLLNRLYPNDAEHIIKYFADAVQNPGRKCNHALVLGSEVHGIGKDTLLQPLKWAVGERNYATISPAEVFNDNNGWVASVIVQISESRNIGDGDGGRISKFDMYERTKDLAAAPPTTLSCVDKWVARHQVRNVLRVIYTTNHGIDGIYLPPQDRRHYCAWSDAAAMPEEESKALYSWYENGGAEEVAAFLYDASHLDGWNPGARPPQTDWWHRLVLEGNAQDDNPLADALDKLGRPEWITAEGLAKEGGPAVASWFADARNRKVAARLLAGMGYKRITNPMERRGRYSFKGEARVVYSRVAINTATFDPK